MLNVVCNGVDVVNEVQIVVSHDKECTRFYSLTHRVRSYYLLTTSNALYCAFFSTAATSATLASSLRLASRRSRPRVINGLGSKSANKYLQIFSITQHPAKSIIITLVNFTLNYEKSQSGAEMKA